MALDELILRHHGGTQLNSPRHILHLYEDNNPLHILKESPYYDSEKLNSLLKCKRNCLDIMSTIELAALELIDRTMTALDKNYTPFSIFLDLSKAFDTIDYQILLNKLSHYGIKRL